MTDAAPTPPDLPTDASALRVLVLAMMAERDAIAVERDAVTIEHDALAVRAERLEHLLRTLRRLHVQVLVCDTSVQMEHTLKRP